MSENIHWLIFFISLGAAAVGIALINMAVLIHMLFHPPRIWTPMTPPPYEPAPPVAGKE